MSTESVTIEYPEPEYALFDTSRGELPAVVVVNAAPRDFSNRELFVWHLSILIFADEVAERGMPTREETLILDAVADEIERAVLERRNALFLARETCDGTRQLLFRVHNPKEANDVLQILLARPAPKRVWDFRMEGDASWSLAEPCFGLFDSVP